MILPTPAAPFEWRDTRFGPALVCTPLARVAQHLFTTRPWQLGRQNHADVNPWTDVLSAFEPPAGHLVRLRQVHGRHSVVAESQSSAATVLPEGDILLAGTGASVIAVQAADCVPLLVADRRLGIVAAAHGGWRGLAQRVIEESIRQMVEQYQSDPADLIAAIGPCISACCYEVGPDVRDRFREGGLTGPGTGWFFENPRPTAGNPSMPRLALSPRPGHSYFDVWSCARAQLIAAGLSEGNIYLAGLCTASHSAILCSYRRDGKAAGRMAAAIRSPRRP
jgi:YfiH family protein